MDRLVASTLLLLAAASLAAPAQAEETAPAPAEIEFFEKNVRPVFAAYCHECHSADNAESGLRLDTLAGVLEGGDRGPAVAPGKPNESLLIGAINHGEVLQMPPKAKLSAKQIADLTEWVKRGAAWPGESPTATSVSPRKAATGVVTDDDREFWAFQPPQPVALPPVNDRGWARSPIDRFILAELEAHGLKPASPADKRTLLRRVTFDLTGLPPTPEEIDAFLADESPDAYERVVERLLQSPRYGERWGRHWLDIARYADSNGMDENLAFIHAYRYRDYVIRSFNSDKPYDRFVLEQLAGDLLPAEEHETDDARFERLTATGFLSIGPKMLADDDPVKKEMDIIDEQLDTVGKAFMGMTLGCARCHDHKFDPVPAADYYALAGILKSTKTMENFAVVAEWHEHPLESEQRRQERAENQQKVAELDKQIAERKKTEPDSEATKQAVAGLEAEKKELAEKLPAQPRAMGVREGSPQNLRVHLRGSHTTLGPEVPRGFLQVVALPDQPSIDTSRSGRLELARWLVRPDHPLTSRVMVNRMWRWHFRRGIVPSVDNFGRLGDRPTNERLLDWLALEFIRSGWSMKAMHCQIVLSNTYQMSTQFDESAAKVDPENKLMWRFERRRLEAEEVRDSILAISGRLDSHMGGSLVPFENRQYVTNRDRMAASYVSHRRSVYLPIYRSAVYDVLQAFDFADPSTLEGNRPTTTVAPQALFMMNSTIVAESSAALAEKLAGDTSGDDAGRLRTAFIEILGREPEPSETKLFLQSLGELRAGYEVNGETSADAQKKAWRSACRVLFGSNDFVYVD